MAGNVLAFVTPMSNKNKIWETMNPSEDFPWPTYTIECICISWLKSLVSVSIPDPSCEYGLLRGVGGFESVVSIVVLTNIWCRCLYPVSRYSIKISMHMHILDLIVPYCTYIVSKRCQILCQYSVCIHIHVHICCWVFQLWLIIWRISCYILIFFW